MSRVHDALRRAEQGAPLSREQAADVRPGAPRLPEFLPVNPGGPASARSTPRPGFAERSANGGVQSGAGIALARSEHLARNSRRRVPHPAHAPESPPDLAAAAHRNRHQPVARRRQDLQLRQSGAGPGAPDGKLGVAGRFRSAAARDSQSPADRSRARPFRLHHRRVQLRAGAAQDSGHQSLPAAGRHAGEESARAAEYAAVQTVVRGSAAPLQLGDLRYPAAAVLRRRQPALDHGRWHHPGGQGRLHHLRQRDSRHSVAMREQRPRHRRQRRPRLRAVQQVHLLLLEDRVSARRACFSLMKPTYRNRPRAGC